MNLENNILSFRQLKGMLPIESLLVAYGLDHALKRRGDKLFGPCPLHGGDNPTAFRVHLKRNIWRCFTLCGGGDIVELIRRIENCNYAEAAKHLSRLANQQFHQPVALKCFVAPYKPFPFRIPLDPHCDFLQQKKKITVVTAANFEAGCTNKSKFLQDKVAVRLHDSKGQPLGYCGRRLRQAHISRWGKWCFPAGLPKSKILYNAHRALAHRSKGVVVVECPWSVMRLTQAGFSSTVALLGTQMSEPQADWLRKAPRVLLLLDGDRSGIRASISIYNRLAVSTTVFIHQLPKDCEPEDLQDSELLNIVSGAFFFL